MSTPATPKSPLEPFSKPVTKWFEASFEAATPAQAAGWPAIASGKHTLICAPTGSGKTLASFLWGIDRLAREPERLGSGVRIVYVSPLKALSYDIERNLRAPLQGIGAPVSVGLRTGDTPQTERRRMRREPPDILITTPESLYLMISSGAREILGGVEAVIVDEIHAVAPSKRGSHLALTLERLDHLGEQPVQRIGLSATQRPLERIGDFLVGSGRECEIVDASEPKQLDLEIVVPVEDMVEPSPLSNKRRDGADTGKTPHPDLKHSPERIDPGPIEASLDPATNTRSIWPAIYPELLRLVREHSSTIVFVNNRRAAERIAKRLNEMHNDELEEELPATEHAGNSKNGDKGPAEIARAHHGSLSHEERAVVEELLKSGQLPCLVATSSLELGIDMGAVDLVIQVESPKSVTRGLQRVGRAGHTLGEVSKGRIFPKFRADLLECAVVARRMRTGEIEETVIPQNPLDVLAQHLVSMAALDEWEIDEVEKLVRSAQPFAELSREQLENVLDMLDGRYPSERFAELRPRIVWDRTKGTMRGRPGARQLAVANAGTIPDRGLYGVHLPDGRRVGELDEEMVYEARPGQTFLLGASTWRIEEITRDRVIVTPAPGTPGAVPFWRGDGIGRPAELGRAIGAFSREAVNADPKKLAKENDLDKLAAQNLVNYLTEQQAATRVVPSDEAIVIERFRDEIGDWRLCVLSPFGGRVHAAWGLALSAKIRDERDLEADAIWSDDGIVIHLPDADEPPPGDLVMIEPDELEDLVIRELSGSALFGARFRENASRSLLIPRAWPGKRTPLWQQRLKSQSLLEVARDFPRFPVILETYREVMRDVLDLPALKELLRDLHSRKITMVEVETPTASPFASSLLFDYVATYMYEGDTPNAERRAAALALDRDLLAELLGQEELRELIDPEALEEVARAAPASDRGRPGQGPRRPADHPSTARRPHGRGVRAADRAGLFGRLDAREAGQGAPCRRGQGRGRGALHRRRGRRPLSRCPRGASARWPPRELPGAGRRRARLAGQALRRVPCAVPDEAAGGPLRRRSELSPEGAGAIRRPGSRRAAARAGLRESGVSPTSCAGCAAPASPACARRWRRPTSESWPASCRAGRTSMHTVAPARDRIACARHSSRCRAWRSRLRPGNGTSCRADSAPTAPPGSTSSAPAASSSGSAPARSAATTGRSLSTSARMFASPARLRATPSSTVPRGRHTTRSASASPRVPASGSTCSSWRARPRSSTRRSGIWPGRVR